MARKPIRPGNLVARHDGNGERGLLPSAVAVFVVVVVVVSRERLRREGRGGGLRRLCRGERGDVFDHLGAEGVVFVHKAHVGLEARLCVRGWGGCFEDFEREVVEVCGEGYCELF